MIAIATKFVDKTVVPAGYVYAVDSVPAGIDLFVNGRLASRIRGKTYFVFGPYDSEFSQLYSYTQNETRFWENPTLTMRYQDIEVEKDDFTNQSQIRIPASIWQEQQSADEAIKAQEREILRQALRKEQFADFPNCFSAPVKSAIVSKFGSARILPNERQYYHAGVDLRGAVGNNVRASGDGIVVLAQKMTVPGNNIVISHGAGFYSRYMHLNELKVQAGQNVHRGEVIGTVGATGRVEAPHLHWEILWKGTHADPHRFLQAMAPTCGRG